LDPSPQPGTVSNVLGRSVRYVVGLDKKKANMGYGIGGPARKELVFLEYKARVSQN
jgi:hypothetical protein